MVSVSGMSVHRVQSTCKEDIMTRSSIVALALVAGLGLAVLAPLVSAEMPGVTATEIKIGHTNPYSGRSEEHTSELQSRLHLVCRLLLEKKKKKTNGNLYHRISQATC